MVSMTTFVEDGCNIHRKKMPKNYLHVLMLPITMVLK